MAGFIFSISTNEGTDGVKKKVLEGNYAALVPNDLSTLKAKQVTASVLADYCSMKAGDNVYFLSNRRIYGVGKLVNVGDECKYKNYRIAHKLISIDTVDDDDYLWDKTPSARWICFFEPEGNFFEDGIDMDEVLTYKPSSFRMLRAFQDRSFIKIDDEENRALKEFIYLKNHKKNKFMQFSKENHDKISNSHDFSEYKIIPAETIIDAYDTENGELSFEMLLEAALIDKIQANNFNDVNYDYVTHQVIASPFKPLAYIDKMDIFAYKYLSQYPDEQKPIENYVIIELKKGKANASTLAQTMRYVDWICQEYASGDYSLITAYVVAKDYVKGLGKTFDKECSRNFISGTHPIVTSTWTDIHLMTYSIETSGDISLLEYNPFDATEYLKDQLTLLGLKLVKSNIKVKEYNFNPTFKITDKKLAFFKAKDTSNSKRPLEEKGWKIYYIDEIKNKETATDIIKSIIN